MIDLGNLGGSSAQAFGLSSTGQAVGAATTPFGYSNAFTSSGAGVRDLTIGTSASEGIASGVNSSGQVAGTQYIGGQAFAAVWTDGAAQSISGAGSFALAINDGGQVAGALTSNGQGHAFVTSGNGIQDLGTLPGGDWTAAYAINAAGDVAGYGSVGTAFRAFSWSAQAGYSQLGTLGGANSYAHGINAAGTVVGSAQTVGGTLHASQWQGSGPIDLGTLGGSSSYAYGINDSGNIVGFSWDSDGNLHAFLFENGVMYDLNGLIDPASGWVLNQAFAINASGQIVGSGLLNGIEHAFRLDSQAGAASFSGEAVVPEPATWGFLGSGILLLLHRHRRTRAT
jgi:probable HAF family extracellular repeat protein